VLALALLLEQIEVWVTGGDARRHEDAPLVLAALEGVDSDQLPTSAATDGTRKRSEDRSAALRGG
jgi:hypothetical protein